MRSHRLTFVSFLVAAGCGNTVSNMPDMSIECPTGQLYCGLYDKCIDPQTNNGNCGACGKSCRATEKCTGGVCASEKCMMQADCAGDCVDLQTDTRHCGNCGVACAAMQTCQMGRCGMSCTPPLAACGSECVKVDSDVLHCGECGNECDPGSSCFHGVCHLQICGASTLGLPNPPLVATEGAADVTLGNINMYGLDAVVAGAKQIELLLNVESRVAFTRKPLPQMGTVVSPLLVDMNRDQKQDLLVVDASNKQLLAFRGDGDAGFTPAGMAAVGEGPYGLWANDLDEDGRNDVLVLERGSSVVRVLINGGNDTFKPATTVAPPNGVLALALERFDSDQRMDLLVIDKDGVGQLMTGRGDGSFVAPVRVDPPVALRLAAAARLDGDMDVDVVGAADGHLVTLLNLGNKSFQPGKTVPAPQLPTALVVADIDGDKKDDAVIGSAVKTMPAGGNIAVFFGDGEGGFVAGGDYEPYEAITSLAVGDIDGDARPDIVYGQAAHATALGVLINLGGRRFARHRTTDMTRAPSVVTAGDLDGDGAADLVVVSDAARVLWNDGTAGFGAPTDLALPGVTGALIADVDGDKQADLVAFDGKDISVVLGKPGRTFAAPVKVAAAGTSKWLGIGDFDANGKPDIAQLGPGFVFIYKNAGAGKLDPGVGTAAMNNGQAAAVTDFHNDGWPDVVMLEGPSSFGVVINRTRGMLAPSKSWTAGTNNVALAVADIDGDVRMDVLLSGGRMGAYVLTNVRNEGDAVFDAGTDLPVPYQVPELVAGDIDGDSRPELVGSVTFPEAFGVVVVRNLLGKLGPPTLYPTAGVASHPRLADVDGDKRSDVVVVTSRLLGFGTVHTIDALTSTCLPFRTPMKR